MTNTASMQTRLSRTLGISYPVLASRTAQRWLRRSAALVTRAQRDGDDYIVDDSKIWTSGAQHADWMFCLVRTDPAARAQQGISFLLIDMQTPGQLGTAHRWHPRLGGI